MKSTPYKTTYSVFQHMQNGGKAAAWCQLLHFILFLLQNLGRTLLFKVAKFSTSLFCTNFGNFFPFALIIISFLGQSSFKSGSFLWSDHWFRLPACLCLASFLHTISFFLFPSRSTSFSILRPLCNCSKLLILGPPVTPALLFLHTSCASCYPVLSFFSLRSFYSQALLISNFFWEVHQYVRYCASGKTIHPQRLYSVDLRN